MRLFPLTALTALSLSPLTLTFTTAAISEKLWHELGRGIGNENLSDLAGYSVATSASGYTVAVGSPYHTSLIKSNPPKRAGRVRVYRYESSRDGWKQLGQDIEGVNVGDEFGTALHLNDDGDVLAVGYPYCSRDGKKECGCVDVYELTLMVGPEDEDRDVWFQVGVTVVGKDSLEHLGTSVHIEEVYDDEEDVDSYALAVGAPGARVGGIPTGKVYFYDFEWEVGRKTLDWNPTGDITPTVPGGNPELNARFSYSDFGASISMTGNSKTILVGAPKYGDNDEGIVLLYNQIKVSGTIEWDEVQDFEVTNPQSSYEYNCGSAVSIDWSGNYVAYGCPGSASDPSNTSESLFQAGCVHTYMKAPTTGNVWELKDVVYGEGEGDRAGSAVRLSKLDDGHIFMAVGAPKNSPLDDFDNTGKDVQEAGHVRVYFSKAGIEPWEQAGLDVDGLSADDHYGSSVAISNKGHILAAGAPDGGYAKVYLLDYTAPPTPGPTVGSGSNGGGSGGGGGSGSGSGSLDKDFQRSSTSVWFVFFISIFAIGTIFALFLAGKKMRERGSGSFTNVSTQDRDMGMMSSGTEMVANPGVVSSTGETRDII